MKEQLEKIQREARSAIQAATGLDQLQEVENTYLGRKSTLTNLARTIKDLPAADRPVLGALANSVRQMISQALSEKKQALSPAVESAVTLDPTLPGLVPELGSLHPITLFLAKIVEIFRSMGFEVAEGPEVETAEYNFDKLNIPKDHPARDLWDTFYVRPTGGTRADELVMRTHTSPMQLHYLENHRPPVKVIVPGRCFRHEATDASHESNFYQCDGLVIDRGISLAHLIGTLSQFFRELFEADVKIRVRPSFFPFVEPGLEVDMSCLFCHGEGCSVCKRSGWIELLGSGLVHPNVLRNMHLDPKEFSGFAFGIGVERLMLLYYGIPHIHLLYSGDLRFIKQWT